MFKKNIYKARILPVLMLMMLVGMTSSNQAQTVERQCISSYGAVVATSHVALEQTVGQPYSTSVSFLNTTAILPGFQQPVVFRVEAIFSELSKDIDLKVYPNPAACSVKIQSGKAIENAMIQVTDLNGKIILSEQAMQLHIYDINCTAWKSGIYIITVSDKYHNKSSHRLIINK